MPRINAQSGLCGAINLVNLHNTQGVATDCT
jgi:hypothetical protein